MPLLALSEAQICEGASAESFARGLSYYHSGSVGALVLRGGVLQADVAGSQYEPYRVSVSIDAGGVRAASCTCPYEWSGWCKHIVATLLAYGQAKSGDVQVRPPLAELLAGLDRDQLAALLLRLAEHDAMVAETIDTLLVAPSLVATVAPVVVVRHTTIDTATIRRQVRNAFSAADYDEYDAASDIVLALEPLTEQIRAIIDRDDPESAVTLLDALTDELGAHWFEYDDSDGELGDFFAELGRLWAEALLASDLPQVELEMWYRRLNEWGRSANEYGIEGLNLALWAAEEGWSVPWIEQALRGEVTENGPPAGALNRELLGIRLQVLERKGLVREALNLAMATGMHQEQALLLARLGRVDAAAQVGRQHFRLAAEALALAQRLHELGDLAGALAVGEHGLSLTAPRAALGVWLVDFAAGQGQIDLALRAGKEALRTAPDLGLYRRLGKLGGAGWPVLREQLMAVLRSTDAWTGTAGRVDIFLHEGLIDDAIVAVSGPAGASELGRVMDAASATRPDWVIATATARAEAITDAGDAKHYAAAVEWLRRARAAYQASGQSAAWLAYLQVLRVQHRRKSKLMTLLDQFERGRR